MNKKKSYRSKDLRLCIEQYTIKHDSVDEFKVGEEVFLKSNPEHVMSVLNLGDDMVGCVWFNNGEVHKCTFPPECILQYKYAGLITLNKKYIVSLN